MDGYIYCFSNESMPNIFKIGMTTRTPEERLTEANSSSTWKPPTPYKIVFVKRVSNPLQCEKKIHNILSICRINKKREFFHGPLEEIKGLIDTSFTTLKNELTAKEEQIKNLLLEVETIKQSIINVESGKNDEHILKAEQMKIEKLTTKTLKRNETKRKKDEAIAEKKRAEEEAKEANEKAIIAMFVQEHITKGGNKTLRKQLVSNVFKEWFVDSFGHGERKSSITKLHCYIDTKFGVYTLENDWSGIMLIPRYNIDDIC
jgi:hypothetical protein